MVAFISNGGWLDGATEGFRRSIVKEFSSIYVFNLRGNAIPSGELRRKECGNVFGSGTRTSIAITILVKKPEHIGDAAIHYCDIGDYLSREEKLNRIRKYKGIESSLMPWQTIIPNEKGDWINQRDGAFDNLIPLTSQTKGVNNTGCFFDLNSYGLVTGKDVWCINTSKHAVSSNMERMISFYNEQRKSYVKELAKNTELDVMTFVDNDPSKISWTRSIRNSLKNDHEGKFNDGVIVETMYRPFTKQMLYSSAMFNDLTTIKTKCFPTPDHDNLVICVSGVGVTKDFSCIITDKIPDLELIGKSQCFPLYWYQKKDVKQLNLFSAEEESYTRHDAVTDWVLRQFRDRFHAGRQIDKLMIFYYVYGLLHSEDYRTRFAADLKKSLPRIPIVESLQDFLDFEEAGRKLAALHLDYENRKAPESVIVEGDKEVESNAADSPDYDYFAIPDKMTFGKTGKDKDRSTIMYNGHITIKNIPAEAYEYVVNGKSAIEWLMERYVVKTDDKSGIRNDANAWAREHHEPRYILDLLLSVISVSIETQRIVRALPRLTFI